MRRAARNLAIAGKRRSERGLTLVEILVAFAILFFVTLAVLELFTMAYAVQRGAGVRTDLQYRAQRVLEVIRYVDHLRHLDPPVDITGPTLSGVNLPAQVSTTQDLPLLTSDANWAFWGPSGVAVVDLNAPYILSYSVELPAPPGTAYVVTVTARPNPAATTKYLAEGAVYKAVRYAIQIPL